MSRNPFLEMLTAPEQEIPGTFWATVTATNPLRVKRDTEPVLPVTPQTLEQLAVGDRVLCLWERRQVIILGRMGGTPAPVPAYPSPNRIQIGDRSYLLAGSITPPSFTWYSSSNNLYLASIRVNLPYEPPFPYTFLWSTQETAAWTVCANRNRFPSTDGTMLVHIAQFANADTTALKRIQWQLVNA